MKTTILVRKGPFGTIEEAAHAEERIDWNGEAQAAAQTVCTEAWAACELARYLPGGASLRCAEDGMESLTGTVILVGGGNPCIPALESLLGHRVRAAADAAPESFRLYGCERDGKAYVVLTGGSRVGTLYAVGAYLERCGVYFTEPGEPGVCPALCRTETAFDIAEAPSFTTRGTFSSYIAGDDAFLEWMAFNRMNFTKFRGMDARHAVLKKLGIQSSEGGHELYVRFMAPGQPYPYRHAVYGGDGLPDDPYPVSPECRAPTGEGGVMTYGDAHPEWYALVDGRRRMMRQTENPGLNGDNICTGNPDAVTELTRLVTDALADGVWRKADYVDVWALDNGIWCDCPKCRAQGNLSTRLLLLAYTIDKSIKRAQAEGRIRRPLKLVVPAYHETLPAPDRPLPADFDYSTCMVVFFPIERCFAHDIDDPVCVETNAELVRRLLPWTTQEDRNYRGELFIGEYYNVSAFAANPFVLMSRILHDIPYYYSIGVRHFHYMHITARDWGFIAVNNWLYARLLWQTDVDGEALLDTYFTARYGAYAGQMRALYEEVQRVTANCKYAKHYQFVNGRIRSLFREMALEGPATEESLFPLVHMRLDSRADDPQAGPSLTEMAKGLEDARKPLTELLETVPEGRERAAMLRDERRLRYGAEMMRFILLLCRARLDEGHDPALTEALRTRGEHLRATNEALAGYDHGDRMDNELNASWNAATYERVLAERGIT